MSDVQCPEIAFCKSVMNVERKSLFLKEVNILRGKMHDKLLKNDASKMGQSHQSCIRTIKEQM